MESERIINEVAKEIKNNNYIKALELLNNARNKGTECQESACDSCVLVNLSKGLNIAPAEFAEYPTCNELIEHLNNKEVELK